MAEGQGGHAALALPPENLERSAGVWRLLPTGTRWALPIANGPQMSTPRGDFQFADARTKP
jgi:hypothetical protein